RGAIVRSFERGMSRVMLCTVGSLAIYLSHHCELAGPNGCELAGPDEVAPPVYLVGSFGPPPPYIWYIEVAPPIMVAAALVLPAWRACLPWNHVVLACFSLSRAAVSPSNSATLAL